MEGELLGCIFWLQNFCNTRHGHIFGARCCALDAAAGTLYIVLLEVPVARWPREVLCSPPCALPCASELPERVHRQRHFPCPRTVSRVSACMCVCVSSSPHWQARCSSGEAGLDCAVPWPCAHSVEWASTTTPNGYGAVWLVWLKAATAAAL